MRIAYFNMKVQCGAHLSSVRDANRPRSFPECIRGWVKWSNGDVSKLFALNSECLFDVFGLKILTMELFLLLSVVLDFGVESDFDLTKDENFFSHYYFF